MCRPLALALAWPVQAQFKSSAMAKLQYESAYDSFAPLGLLNFNGLTSLRPLHFTVIQYNTATISLKLK
jgi:hypothetical protein